MRTLMSSPSSIEWKPTKEQLTAAQDKRLRDVVAPGLDVLFCGINPSLYSGATGHHFARPGNRFWPALHRSGFTPRLYSPFEDASLIELGLGITNIVNRTTAAASEVTPEEFKSGAKRLQAKVRKYRPRNLAVLGMQAFRIGFGHPVASIGRQPETIGPTTVWLLPNPSGLNAHYRLAELVRIFRRLRRAV